MSDNPLNRIPGFDRISIRAVVVADGEDPGPALAAAGILDPIALPVVFGEAEPEIGFGDAITPNLVAVLERDDVDEFDSPASARGLPAPSGNTVSGTNNNDSYKPSTINLPAAYRIRPLAPVGRSERIAARVPPLPGLLTARSGPDSPGGESVPGHLAEDRTHDRLRNTERRTRG